MGWQVLALRFPSPSAGEYELNETERSSDKAAEIKENAGRYYRMMNEAVHGVLKNLKDNHPAYDAEAGYEIAGFVWFQGFNDQFSPAFRDNYKKNMISFIMDVRRNTRRRRCPSSSGSWERM